MIKADIEHVPGDKVTGTIIVNNTLVLTAVYNFKSDRWVLRNAGGSLAFSGQCPPPLKIHKKTIHSSAFMIVQFAEEYRPTTRTIMYVQGQLGKDAIRDRYPSAVFSVGMKRLKALKLLRDIVTTWEKMRVDMIEKEKV